MPSLISVNKTIRYSKGREGTVRQVWLLQNCSLPAISWLSLNQVESFNKQIKV